MHMRSLPLILVMFTVFGLFGCTQRMITITSAPPGALVHLNNQEVGRTPLSVPFTFYGVYDVRLEAEGYEPLTVAQDAAAPLWDLPGPDLIAEMVPGSKVELKWHYDLTPKSPPDPDAVVDRARQMRALLGPPPAGEERVERGE